MYKYGQYCPVARAVEVLGDRWTLLIVRDLLCGTRHFNDLERGLPGISRSVLSERLRRLGRMGVVVKQTGPNGQGTEYVLTRAGEELKPVIDSLTVWGADWSFGEPDPAELDPVLLLWWMRSRVCTDRLPRERIVVEFEFRGCDKKNFWLVLGRDDVSVCLVHPRFEIDVLVRAHLADFYQVWLGHLDFARALHEQLVEVEAPPALERGFISWFALSPTAEAVRRAAAAAAG